MSCGSAFTISAFCVVSAIILTPLALKLEIPFCVLLEELLLLRLIPELVLFCELNDCEFELLLSFIKLFIVLLFELFDEFVLETACPVTKPCKISDKFFALAYFKRKTFNPPNRSAAGTSKVSIILRIRLRVAVSPLMIIRLVRLSAMIRIRDPFGSFDAPVELIDSNSPIISSA